MQGDSIINNFDSTNNEANQWLLIDSLGTKTDTNILGFKDYIIQTLNENIPPIVERESLFKQKSFVSKELKIIERPNHQPEGWVYGVIFSVIITYLLLAKLFLKKTNQIFNGALSHSILLPISLTLFSPTIAILIYAAISYFNSFSVIPIQSHFLIFLFLFLGSAIFFTIRYVLIYFFGILFKTKEACFKYNSNQIGFYFINVLILMPIAFLYYYLPANTNNILLIILLVAISILLVIRVVRGLIIVLNQAKFSKFYLFFYLCTLEILPILIIIKLLISY